MHFHIAVDCVGRQVVMNEGVASPPSLLNAQGLPQAFGRADCFMHGLAYLHVAAISSAYDIAYSIRMHGPNGTPCIAHQSQFEHCRWVTLMQQTATNGSKDRFGEVLHSCMSYDRSKFGSSSDLALEQERDT